MNTTRLSRRRLIGSAASLLALLLATGFAGQAMAATSLEQMREFSRSARSARGEFTQRTLKANGQVAEASSGVFAFARPGKFRWEVKRPFEQLMVADGEQVFFFDKDLNQVTVRKMGDALGATPAAILFGSAELDQTFVLKDQGDRDGLSWLEARPKSKEAGFESIGIGLRDGLPVGMEVRDAFGRLTLFTFSRIERNAATDAQEFRFVTPRGAEVVQQ